MGEEGQVGQVGEAECEMIVDRDHKWAEAQAAQTVEGNENLQSKSKSMINAPARLDP